MNENEIKKILTLSNAAIIAPAGHGKTEMIVDIVKYASRRQLLLTHTNAGVDVISKRLTKKGISRKKYKVTTIAAFCRKWCISYNNSAHFNKELSPEDNNYYPQLYNGSKNIFKSKWANKVLCATYGGLIIDEYQDCNVKQHEIFVILNKYLPIIVLGDPMQGIFSFTENLVSWDALPFKQLEIQTRPWRWQNTNPQLGKYLGTIRSSLLPVLHGKLCTITIDSCNGSIEFISEEKLKNFSFLKQLMQYKNTVLITQWSHKQLSFCKQMPSFFQYDEVQNCKKLFDFAIKFDSKSGTDLLYSIIEFVGLCATKVTTELSAYSKRLKNGSLDFSRIKKHTEFRDLIIEIKDDEKSNKILKVLDWFYQNRSMFKIYREELFQEMIRSVQFAYAKGITLSEATDQIRRNPSFQKSYSNFRYLSSRTLLSKGLEFDCVIVDMKPQLSTKDFYVAMTRAMRKVYIISDSNTFTFCK